MAIIHRLLFTWAKEDPLQKIIEYVEKLEVAGFSCSREFVRQVFVSWRWSWKRPSYKQIEKYTSRNIIYYIQFLSWINQQDPIKLKYMDEVHFVSKGKNIHLSTDFLKMLIEEEDLVQLESQY